jgi:putative transposase
MQCGIRFRANPSSDLRLLLAQWMGAQRAIYNAKCAEARYYRSFARKSLQHTGLYAPEDQAYSQFKSRELTPWLYAVPSEILRNGAVRYQQALSRFKQRLAGRPRNKKKGTRQSVWLTSELFRFEPQPDGAHRLIIGREGKKPVGEIPFIAHTDYKLPNSIVVSRCGGKWHVSFSYEDGLPEPDEAEIIAHYAGMCAEQLESVSAGFDRGVVKPFADSAERSFDFSPAQKQHLQQLEQRRKRYERRMARCRKGSNRHHKAAGRVARQHARATNIRRDFAHQTSHALVNSSIEVFIAEDLRIRSMVKKAAPQPVIDPVTGAIVTAKNGAIKYRKNQRKAKSGLARSILASCWGQTWTYVQYKARRKAKLTIKVPPFNSSVECAECGHTHPDNRPDQATFRCNKCGNESNADFNASRVIKRRGIKALLLGEVKAPKRKQTLRMAHKQQQVGADRSEPGETPQLETAAATPEPRQQHRRGGDRVRRQGGNASPALRSMKRETPTSSCKAA